APVARPSNAISRFDSSLLLPGRPLIVEIVALHLMRRRSHTPGEIGREDVGEVDGGAVIHCQIYRVLPIVTPRGILVHKIDKRRSSAGAQDSPCTACGRTFLEPALEAAHPQSSLRNITNVVTIERH